MSTDVRLNDDGYNTSIKWTFVGNGGNQSSLFELCSKHLGCTAEASMRKEEEKSANPCSALAYDDEFDGDVKLLTMNDADVHDFEELVFWSELPLPESHNCSHRFC